MLLTDKICMTIMFGLLIISIIYDYINIYNPSLTLFLIYLIIFIPLKIHVANTVNLWIHFMLFYSYISYEFLTYDFKGLLIVLGFINTGIVSMLLLGINYCIPFAMQVYNRFRGLDFNQIMKLFIPSQKIDFTISNLLDRIKDDCSICMEALHDPDEEQAQEKITITSCEHVFHKKCIDTWMLNNNICPICRTRL